MRPSPSNLDEAVARLPHEYDCPALLDSWSGLKLCECARGYVVEYLRAARALTP